MKENDAVPKVFISYSWTSEEHIKWVIGLAESLMYDGVNVIIDRWDLTEGQDKYKFMEQMVNSSDITRVLIICDKSYSDKADAREKGVGEETLIITPQVYNDAEQDKFIPIIVEVDESGKPYLPSFIKSRIFVDMSSDDKYELGYEKLIRNIYMRPEHRKPQLGSPPAYLFEDVIIPRELDNLIKRIEDSFERNPKRIQGLTDNYVDSFIGSLDEFVISDTQKLNDQMVYDHIMAMKILRDNYIKFIELLCKNQEFVDQEIIIKLFERMYDYTQPTRDLRNYTDMQFDHYKFFIRELFLYTMSILIEKNQYKVAGQLLSSKFYVYRHRRTKKEFHDYVIFNEPVSSIDEIRKNRLESNLLSMSSEILMNRADNEKYSKEKIVDCDIILFYISEMDELEKYWRPKAYIYKSEDDSIELIQRLKSTRHFMQIKDLFKVETKEDLISKLSKLNDSAIQDANQWRGYSGAFQNIPRIQQSIDLKEICSIP